MEHYLRKAGVMWKDFKQFAIGLTGRVRQAAEDKAKEQQRPVIYLASSRASKEDEARQIQQRDGVKKGLIAIMSCVEPWRRWCMHGNRATKRVEQVMRYMGRSGRVGINDEVVTDRRRRSVGVRVKHWLNKNSLKFYDKGSVLRDEVTINEPKDFRVWRGAENKPSSKKQWRVL